MRSPTRADASISTSRGLPPEKSVSVRFAVKSNDATGKPELAVSYSRIVWSSSLATNANPPPASTAVEASAAPWWKRVVLGIAAGAEAA